MSISRENSAPSRALSGSAPLGFRVRLTLLLMTVVVTLTFLALYITQRSTQSADQRVLQERFQSRLNYLSEPRKRVTQR